MTLTNSCLGFLDPARISKRGRGWQPVSGDPPTRELPQRCAFCDNRPGTGAVAHRHSTCEELEETARLLFVTRDMPVRMLTPEQIATLNTRFALK